MTTEKLHEYLEKDLTLVEVRQIIYELKNDCICFEMDPYRAGYYNGEVNAFYIVLDLLGRIKNV